MFKRCNVLYVIVIGELVVLEVAVVVEVVVAIVVVTVVVDEAAVVSVNGSVLTGLGQNG